MHARAGLEVGYLSEEWFSLVRFAAEYAYERGLDAYLYDENGWPSGYGGGRVPALGKQFCQSWLTPFHGTDEELAAAGGERVADGFARFYNKYYSNLMAPSAVQAFIDCTHEQYRLHLGDLFGKQIKGIFTDEPQLSNFGYPDSPALFEEFERTYGYRLQDRLNDLIVDDKDKSKGEQTRYDYRKLVAKLYRGYTQKIGAWCRRNRLIFTGHMAAEDGLYAQLQTQGDVMPCYLDFGMPGIDSLGKKYPTITLVKQVASVAEQSGKRDVLSETFGTSGHAARPSDWLRIWFFEAMYGVDVACMHLSAYSSVGRRKRDYPPDFSPHLNYFQHLTSLTSPLRKLSEFAAFGKRKADILVINPIGAFWAGYSNRRKSLPAHGATYLDKLFEEGVEEDLSEITVNYRMLQELLLELGFDYHIGDENVMRELKAHCKNGVLTVGEYDYHTVILPFGCRVEEDTGGLLEAFARGGGKLLFTQKVPTYSEGRREERFERLFSEG
jgi:hypothetical protein